MTTTITQLISELPRRHKPHIFGGTVANGELRFGRSIDAARWASAACIGDEVTLVEVDAHGTPAPAAPLFATSSCARPAPIAPDAAVVVRAHLAVCPHESVVAHLTAADAAHVLDTSVEQVLAWLESDRAHLEDGVVREDAIDLSWITDASESGRIPATPDWSRLYVSDDSGN